MTQEEKIEIIKKIIDKSVIPVSIFEDKPIYYNKKFEEITKENDILEKINKIIAENKSEETIKENNKNFKINIEKINLDKTYYIVQLEELLEKKYIDSFPYFNKNPIIEISKDGKIIYKNPAAKIFEIKNENINNIISISKIKERINQSESNFEFNYKSNFFHVEIIPFENYYRLYFFDITEKVKTEKKLKIIEKAFNSIHEAIMITDKENKIILVNPMFTRITGYEENEAIGKNPSFQSSKKHDKDFYIKIWESLYRDGFWEGNIWNRKKDGSIYLARFTISVIKNENNLIENYIAIFEDITEQQESKNTINFIVNHDPLTGLLNRASFEEKISEKIENLNNNKNLALILLNIKSFRKINSTLSFVIGDFVLIETANKIKNLFKNSLIARYNADVFSILLEYENIHKDKLNQEIRSMIDLFKEPLVIKNKEIFINVNLGISVYPEDAKNTYRLLQNAEESLYKAKTSGLNFWVHKDSEKTEEDYNMENFLRKALKENLFELYYQPQINSLNNSLYGAEILIRLRDLDGNYISPRSFIPTAEKTGIIIDIGEWIFDRSFKNFYNWFYIKRYDPINLSINLSPRQFRDPNLIGMIERKLKMINIETKYITLEITEGVAVDNIKDIIEKINYLKGISFTIAIDDFGTGYSSLAYIKNLPIDKIKIDQAFIRGLPDSKEDFAIVVAIINLASNLGFDIIAEGAETKEQVELLKRLGCYIIQGYYYSKPLPEQAFESLYLEKINDTEIIE